ncbi:unnamed protein product [Phytomonas sp. Hart1]|nr:unnamed protein product [Phytomonas sp. Hart1]|eukprot:CCW71294.1 unnamed protein product [Phytomonas sp. isolate Hart1]
MTNLKNELAVSDGARTLIPNEPNEGASLDCINNGAAGGDVSDQSILPYREAVHRLWLHNGGKSKPKRKRVPSIRVPKPRDAFNLPHLKREKDKEDAEKPIAYLAKNFQTRAAAPTTCHVNASLTTKESKGRHVDAIHKYFQYYLPEHPPAYTSKEVYFRMAVPEDRKEWSRLLLASCAGHIAGMELQRAALEASCRIVAVRAADEALVGLAAMQGQGWLSFIACDAKYRRKGLGSFLLFLALEWLRVRQGTSASLTPINRTVMAFYRKWGFQAFQAEGCTLGRQKKKLDPSDVVMERKIDTEVCLLPNGKPLKFYLRNYDSTGEVRNTSPWIYYYYTPKLNNPS